MSPDVTRIVLLPRFSTFVGAQTYTSQPVRARDFASANIAFWRTAAMGASPTVAIAVQQSADLQLWWELETDSDPDADAETTLSPSFTMDWMRFTLTLGGTAPALTCWAVGDFLVRKS